MAKNYVEQFMEDNELKYNQIFKIRYPWYTAVGDEVYEIVTTDGLMRIDGDKIKIANDSLHFLLSGKATVVKLEPKIEKIRYLLKTKPLLDKNLADKINEIIDAVNAINKKLEERNES